MHYKIEPFNSFPPKFGLRLAQINDENNVSFQLHLGTSSMIDDGYHNRMFGVSD